MKNILFVSSSPRGAESYSHQVAQRVVDDLKSRHSQVKVVVRDVAKQPPPHIGEDFVNGIAGPPEKLTPDQARALALSDARAIAAAYQQSEQVISQVE